MQWMTLEGTLVPGTGAVMARTPHVLLKWLGESLQPAPL